MNTTVFCATSVDGYIARVDGDVSWLGGPPTDGCDGGFSALMERIDYLVMGRNTFEMVLSFRTWPYGKPVVVLSSKPLAVPDNLIDKVEAMSAPPSEVVAELTSRGATHLYVDG